MIASGTYALLRALARKPRREGTTRSQRVASAMREGFVEVREGMLTLTIRGLWALDMTEDKRRREDAEDRAA